MRSGPCVIRSGPCHALRPAAPCLAGGDQLSISDTFWASSVSGGGLVSSIEPAEGLASRSVPAEGTQKAISPNEIGLLGPLLSALQPASGGPRVRPALSAPRKAMFFSKMVRSCALPPPVGPPAPRYASGAGPRVLVNRGKINESGRVIAHGALKTAVLVSPGSLPSALALTNCCREGTGAAPWQHSRNCLPQKIGKDPNYAYI